MKVILDFDVFDEDSLKLILRDLGFEGDLEDTFRRLSENLYVTSIPIPRDRSLLEDLKGFRIDPNRICDLDRRVLRLLKYCRQIEEPFMVREVYERNGVRILIAEDLEGVVVLETNVDDVSCEVISHAMEKIMSMAIDVYTFHCIGKKGRPCFMIKVLVDEGKALEVARVMCSELPTLGVRMYRVCRYRVDRRVVERRVEIFGREFDLRVKVSDVSIKPEFDDVRRIAENVDKPLPVVYLEILRRLRDEDINWK
ncbi:MAG: hypothetical protein DRP01_07145 [Archaeoglobales archaeon]|nr:MAG: hypothetical protein DRP01_07145 [Archaeoglobales archaeon]